MVRTGDIPDSAKVEPGPFIRVQVPFWGTEYTRQGCFFSTFESIMREGWKIIYKRNVMIIIDL